MEEQLIYKYLSDQTTAQEDKELLEWLNASEENRQLFFELKTLWQLKSGLMGADSWATRRSLEKLNRRIDSDSDNSKPSPANRPPRDASSEKLSSPAGPKVSSSSGKKIPHLPSSRPLHRRPRLVAGSCLAAVLILASGFFFYYTIPGTHPVEVEASTLINTFTDSVLQVRLADGSTIWLNEQASLTYPAHFTGDRREVRLNGNAFFEVKKDSLHPFVVSTDLYNVEVLGTSFSINTRNSDDLAETILLEGAVRLEKPGGERLVDLHPGQQALYSKSQETVQVKEIDARQHALWRFGILSLCDVSIEEIIRTLQDTYHIRIQMDSRPFQHHRYNFSFKPSGDPEEALRHLSYLTGAEATLAR